MQDLNKYLSFSDWARQVAAASNSDPRKIAIHNICIFNFLTGPCTAGTLIDNLTHEMVLKVCQWYDTSETDCSSSSISGWRNAIQNYSTWAEMNMQSLMKLKTVSLKAFMSSGASGRDFAKPPGLPINSIEWQRSAINSGHWPDGFLIYKANLGVIDKVGINSCSGNCGLGNFFDNGNKDHYNHIHLKY